MRLGIRGKELLGITLLVLLIVSLMTVVHLSTTTRLVVQEAADKATLLARQIFAGSTRALARSGQRSAAEALRRDRELRALLDSTIGYSPHLLYAMIADLSDTVLVHSQRSREGQKASPRPQIETLLGMTPLRQLLVLARERPVFEMTLPITLNDRPFGAIRLGLAGSLLWRELSAATRQTLVLATVAFPLAWAVALGLSHLVLVPLRRIAHGVERLARGEFDATVTTSRDDELGQIAAQLNLLGRQIQEDRSSLLSEKARLEQIVQGLEDAVILLNRDQAIIFANQAAERYLNHPLVEATGRRLLDILGADHPLGRAVGEAFRRQQPVRNLALRGADPARPAAELLASVFPVPDGGSVVGGMIFVKNPEPIRQIQSLYDYSRKLDELGQLTSGVAHEVKNPLNAMIIHLELLHQKLREAPEDVAQNLEVLREEIRRLDRVVQGFLRFIRPQAVQFLPVDLNTLLQHVVQLTRAEWEQVGITFVVHLDPAIPAVNGDAALLQQAFLNLVLNACQAMPDGGAVTLRTERASDGTIRAQVIDEGIGIPREDLDKVFRLYYTTKPDGSGIGLSLVYRIVQMHGGTIAVDSTVGSGTAITVTLPGPQAG